MTSTGRSRAQPNPGSPRLTRIQQLTSLLPAAERVLDAHLPDRDGLCRGCHDLWYRLTPYPCTQARWATSVIDRIPTRATLALLGLSPDGLGAAVNG